MSDLETLKNQLVRKASKAIVGGFRPPDDPLASWFGKVRVARQEEDWPLSNGRLMMPLCQLNLEEAPYKPEALQDVALITVFIDPYELPVTDTPNGQGWLLRAYPSMSGLVPLEQANHRMIIKPFPIQWELLDGDYPAWEDACDIDMPAEIEENYYDYFTTVNGTKLGGWPSVIQNQVYWAPPDQRTPDLEYVFQIDSEPKANWAWGDRGCGYFGRGSGSAKDIWTMTWQCY